MADRQITVGRTMGPVDGNLETSAQTNTGEEDYYDS